MGLLRLFDGKADIVGLVLRHYRGASGWGAARFERQQSTACSMGPAGDRAGRIHRIRAHTGEKLLCPLSCDSPVMSIDWHDNRIAAGCFHGKIRVLDAQSGDCLSTVKVDHVT